MKDKIKKAIGDVLLKIVNSDDPNDYFYKEARRWERIQQELTDSVYRSLHDNGNTAEGEHLAEDGSNYDKNAYEKPAVTVDIAICSIMDNNLKVLLIKRKHPPYRDHWAIPGGFVDIETRQTLDKTAHRELQEETGLRNVYLEQLKSYGDPDRDPRMRIITVAHFALVPMDRLNEITAGDDAKEAGWFSLRDLPDLAFDHEQILSDLLERLVGKISYTPIGFELVPEKFTWTQLQTVYEIILGKKLNDSNFRRKIKSMYIIHTLKGVAKDKRPGRPSGYLSYGGMRGF